MKKTVIITGIVLALFGSGLYYFLSHRLITPPGAVTEIVHIDVPESSFNLPIIINLTTLSNFLNGKINGRFLETKLYLQESKKERIALALIKTSDIHISSTGTELVCTFPLTIEATLLESRFGNLLTKAVKPVSARLIVTLCSPATLDNAWRLKTRFRLKSYRWITEPIVRFGPFEKNLTSTVDQLIMEEKRGLSVMLDREINKGVSLEKTVAEIWTDIQDPIMVSRVETPVWIRFLCRDIKGDFKLDKSKITCYTSIKARMMVMTDTTNMAKPSHLPPFKRMTPQERDPLSHVYIYAYTSFDEINDRLNELLTGRDILATGYVRRYTISIKNIHAYASTDGLAIAVKTGKDLNGDFVLTGYPEFDVATQSLKIRNFDYAVDSHSILVNQGNDLLHTRLRDIVAAKLNLQLDTLIRKIPAIAIKAIGKGNRGRAIQLTMKEVRVKKCAIRMGKQKIHFLIDTETEGAFWLKRIDPGTPLRINSCPD
ncbi:MAG: DUF4403 family protein [Chlorobiaceae bacterium]|nr:DUF4403 family protein [Chlorobiaceae bacterium]